MPQDPGFDYEINVVGENESGLDEAMPAWMVSIATAGDLVQWHPHLHLLVSDGGKTAASGSMFC